MLLSYPSSSLHHSLDPMNSYTSYTPHKDDKRELLLQQHYSIAEPKQLTFSVDGTDHEGRSQRTIHLDNKLSKPKRSQVKNACVNCQKACKKCDEGRPCQRCLKYNLVETCQDSIRKERKKGVKRGPYKTNKLKEKNKNNLKKQEETSLRQRPIIHDEAANLFSINGSPQQVNQMSVSPSHGEECKAKFVTQSPAIIASYHDGMSKYTANAQQIYFNHIPAIYPNLNEEIVYNYDNDNVTTIPSPMSNHNDSSVIMTSYNAYMPSVPHGQETTNMYAFQNDAILHEGTNIYGTPTGSPSHLYSQSDIPMVPWGEMDHGFLSSVDPSF